MDREEDLSMMKEQYSVAQQLYENKIQVLKVSASNDLPDVLD